MNTRNITIASVIAIGFVLSIGVMQGVVSPVSVAQSSSVEIGLLELAANNETKGYAVPASGHSAPTPACGATINTCINSSFRDVADSSTAAQWRCEYTYYGSTGEASWTETRFLSCSAPLPPVCGAAINSCTVGSFSDQADTATEARWACTNGGASANCAALLPPAASISVAGCTIPIGESDCTTTVTWSSVNPVPPVSVRQNGSEFSTAASQPTPLSRTLSHGSNTFTYLHSGGFELTRRVANAGCDSISMWDATTGACIFDPSNIDLSLDLSRHLIRQGETVEVEWEIAGINGSGMTFTCQLFGAGLASVPAATVTGITTDQALPNVTSLAIESATDIFMYCYYADDLATPLAVTSSRVDVVPSITEI